MTDCAELPSHFEKAGELVSTERMAKAFPCGPDPDKHLNAIRQHIKAGHDHIYIHQIEPEQEAFIDFCAREILPKVRSLAQEA